MDKIDLNILKCLKENSRQTASMISQTINLSVSAVIERIRKMEQKGMIQRYTVILDEKQLGNDLTVFISIRLEHPKYGEDIKQMAGVSWTKTLYVLSTVKNDISVLPQE